MSLKKLLSLKTCSFVKEINESKVFFTPLSQMVKHNITSEWIRLQQLIPGFHVFLTPLVLDSDPIPYKQINSLKTIVDNYEPTYSNWIEDSCYSFGFIERFVCIRDSLKLNTFWNGSKFDSILLALFCPKHESLHWFQKLQAIHYQWFRNFSKSPLKSKFYYEVQDETRKWSLNYKTDSSYNTLETIEHFSDSLLPEKLNLKNHDLIICNIDLDNSLTAFLCDAFTQKDNSDEETTYMMRFDASLAPFKIAFTFKENTQLNNDLIDLTYYLINTIKDSEITTYPFTPNRLISLNGCDELGIPYSLILDNKSCTNGVIALRNRDTIIEENIHISKLQQSIRAYLNLNSSTNILIKDKRMRTES